MAGAGGRPGRRVALPGQVRRYCTCCPGLWFPHFGSKGATGPFLGPQELCGPGGMALPSGSGWCTWGTWAGSG